MTPRTGLSIRIIPARLRRILAGAAIGLVAGLLCLALSEISIFGHRDTVLERFEHTTLDFRMKKLGDAKLPQKAAPIICNSGEPHSIDFNVGGSVNTALWIDRELQLPPGEYEAKFVYYAQSKGLLEEALEDLESNTLRILISK